MTAFVVYNKTTKDFWTGWDWTEKLTNAKLFPEIKIKDVPENELFAIGKVSVNFIETVPDYKYK